MNFWKEVRELTEILNDFLKDFDCTAKLGEDFCYWQSISEINYSFIVSATGDRLFSNFVKSEFPDIQADLFLWSFLHELGHHETIDDLTEWEDKYSHSNKKIIREALKICPKEEYDDIYSSYFSLPDEIAATTWAANYMRNHKEKIAILWGEIRSHILTIYNSIDDIDIY